MRVSIDFTEGRLANKNDARNPWTGAGHAAGLHRPQQPRDRPLLGRGAGQSRRPHLPRRRLRLRALHGRAVREAAEQDVPAQRGLLPDPVLQRGRPRARLRLCGQYSRADATASRRSASWASSIRSTPRSRRAERVRDELLTASKHIPVDRLGATDDCGFSPFSRDVKPKHGSPTSRATSRCRRSRRGSPAPSSRARSLGSPRASDPRSRSGAPPVAGGAPRARQRRRAAIETSPARMQAAPASCSSGRILPQQQDHAEHDRADRLDREGHRRQRRGQARQRDADQHPAEHLRRQRERDQPGGGRPRGGEVVDAEHDRDRQRGDGRRPRSRRTAVRPGAAGPRCRGAARG